MVVYATVDDITVLWRAMTEAEEQRAAELLPVVSSTLRTEAKRVGKDLDAMVEADEDLAIVAKSVTVDIVARVLMTATDQEPLSQYSQSAGGYTVSGTYLVPGGGLFVKNAELKRLGLLRQQYGMVNPYDD